MNVNALPARGHERHERDLIGLYKHYLRCSRRHAELREAHIECLGDSLCDPSVRPPSAADLEALDALDKAERRAHEQYLHCVRATTLRLIGRLSGRRSVVLPYRRASTHVEPAGPARER